MKKILVLLIASLVWVSCEDKISHKYEVIHHGNKVDTITTSKFTFYLENKAVDAREGGCFTEVVQIKRID